MNSIIKKIRYELKKNCDEKFKKSGQRFFKEEVKLYGVKSWIVRKISKDNFKNIKDKTKKELFAICEELLKSGYLEESFIACHWSEFSNKDFDKPDINTFEHWIDRYIKNWATCDTFCNHTVGGYIEKYPEKIQVLKKWAKSDNLWMRRSSAVSLIIPAKRGLFLNQIFEIANILLEDKNDMVQKGCGWMLKEASKNHTDEIFNYVLENKKKMPRTVLRYAIEKMPKDLKVKAMKRE
ncbi:DNA alkylation repair protein [Candidatus Dependentiae bacterium]|nr:DNA alkylation repair protein [Candidatus Dependentiae bacterium]